MSSALFCGKISKSKNAQNYAKQKCGQSSSNLVIHKLSTTQKQKNSEKYSYAPTYPQNPHISTQFSVINSPRQTK
jgi:hypothetical protein